MSCPGYLQCIEHTFAERLPYSALCEALRNARETTEENKTWTQVQGKLTMGRRQGEGEGKQPPFAESSLWAWDRAM